MAELVTVELFLLFEYERLRDALTGMRRSLHVARELVRRRLLKVRHPAVADSEHEKTDNLQHARETEAQHAAVAPALSASGWGGVEDGSQVCGVVAVGDHKPTLY